MAPLLVNTPELMTRVRVLATKDNSTKTLKTLHTAGVLHVEESEELKPVDREAVERERKEVSRLSADIDDVLAYLPEGEALALAEDIEVIYTRPLGEIDSEVRSLCTGLANRHRRLARLKEEVGELTDLSDYLAALTRQGDISLADLDFSGSYLFTRVFILPREAYDALHRDIKDYLFKSVAATHEKETVFYTVARVEDREAVETAVKNAGGRVLQIPGDDMTVREFVEMTGEKVGSLEEEITKLHEEIVKETGENLERLVLFREALSAEAERLAVLEKASEANYVALFEGWIPETSADTVTGLLKEKVGQVFVDMRKPEPTEDPPTKMKNAAAVKPFEVIVNMFGTPGYREWDPTPVTAYSFAVFFGLMLCDVAYGIGIILAARYVIRKFVDDPYTEGYRLFQRVLYTSGLVALVLGLLAGNYLGDGLQLVLGVESTALLEPVRHALTDPITFIIISIVLGIVHVNAAHAMAMVSGARKGDKGTVVSKIALFTLQICAIPLILLWLFSIRLPVPLVTYTVFIYGLGASVAAIIVSSFMQRGGLGSIFWIFDMTGLLGDLMSYARLAGVGLATFYLAASFNMLAQVFSGIIPGVIGVIVGVIIAIAVLVFGHLINLALSGIGCFVHSLRLCFVEFLSKFYEGGGEEYSPLRLKTRPVFVKGKA